MKRTLYYLLEPTRYLKELKMILNLEVLSDY